MAFPQFTHLQLLQNSDLAQSSFWAKFGPQTEHILESSWRYSGQWECLNCQQPSTWCEWSRLQPSVCQATAFPVASLYALWIPNQHLITVSWELESITSISSHRCDPLPKDHLEPLCCHPPDCHYCLCLKPHAICPSRRSWTLSDMDIGLNQTKHKDASWNIIVMLLVALLKGQSIELPIFITFFLCFQHHSKQFSYVNSHHLYNNPWISYYNHYQFLIYKANLTEHAKVLYPNIQSS